MLNIKSEILEKVKYIEPYKKEYEYDKNIDDYIKDIDLDKYKNDKPKHDIVLMIDFVYMFNICVFNNNPSKISY